MSSPNAAAANVGTPAACSGSHSDWAAANCDQLTATTPFSTIWFAQSVVPPGSPLASHVTTSIGRPPMPPWWALKYSAVAWAARSSSVLS